MKFSQAKPKIKMSKIAIVTAFRRMPENYSLVNDVIDQIKTLKKNGHEVVFYAQEGCKGEGIDCEMRAVLPHFRTIKNEENSEAKEKMIEIFNEEFKDVDTVITHDLMYLRGYYTHRMAIMQCGYEGKWIHWCHSAVGANLKLKMAHSKYIYMNYADTKRFATSIGVDLDDVRVVFNDKDARLFFDWNPISYEISEKFDLFNRDVMQTYPMCSTRMNAKGIDHVIRTFGKLKSLDNRVLLIVPNANARKRGDDIEAKIKLGEQCGLTKDELVFTSTVNPDWTGGVPRDVVRDLMQISNLFVFPSSSEVCSNVLLEASMTKQLLVLNKDFPPFFDFGEEGRTCLGHHFGSLIRTGFKYRTEEAYLNLAKVINQQLLGSKSNQQFLKIKQACNIDTLYRKQLEPVLVENY